LKKGLSDSESRLREMRDEMSAKSSRLDSLQELEAQFAGYGQGIRTILLAERFQGRFHGMVADAVETDEAYETAVEAALGERLQYLLSGGSDDVMEAIGFLKESSGGRCSFITRIEASPPASPPSGAVSLLDKVRIASDYTHLIRPLLAGVYLVEDLRAACGMADEFPEFTFVTPHGELVHSSGVIHGGSMEGGRQGVIHKKREIRDLSREVGVLKERVGKAEAGRSALLLDIAGTEEELGDIRQQMHGAELGAANAEKDLLRAREDRQRLEERLALKRMEDEQYLEERDSLKGEMADSATGRNTAEERKSVLDRELGVLQENLAARRREVEEVRAAVTAAKVTVASLQEKRDSYRRAEARGRDLIGELHGRIEGCAKELEKVNGDSALIAAEVEVGGNTLKSLMSRLADAEKSLEGIRGLYETEVAALQKEEGDLKSLRAACEDARKRGAEQGIRITELSMKLDHLENSVFERSRMGMEEIVSRYAEAEFDEPAKRKRQEELNRLIDDIGEVNLTAIEEYRQLEERFNFLSAQRADLEESMQGLQQAIQRINRTTRKRFLETFQMVNAKFREVFPRLFCGGSAELRLTDESDLLETGIDIVVQPPGKKLQNVSLLSGGEKALTAVALVFSIFLIKPSPFCLLDEVDAPLDDANIGRFNEMVREMSAFSQFILITHNKATMAVADTLFGVTMEEAGVSKLVSVKLN
jgi:chromosome segregation protein